MTLPLFESFRVIKLTSVEDEEFTRPDPGLDFSEDDEIFDQTDTDQSEIDGIDVDQESIPDDTDEFDGDVDPEEYTDRDEESDTDDDADENINPDRQGLIRTVPNAHLVYKRKEPTGTFSELWAYNVPDLRAELQIRQAILSGTDIPINQTQSDDGSQQYRMWSVGNGELLKITGLPN